MTFFVIFVTIKVLMLRNEQDDMGIFFQTS